MYIKLDSTKADAYERVGRCTRGYGARTFMLAVSAAGATRRTLKGTKDPDGPSARYNGEY